MAAVIQIQAGVRRSGREEAKALPGASHGSPGVPGPLPGPLTQRQSRRRRRGPRLGAAIQTRRRCLPIPPDVEDARLGEEREPEGRAHGHRPPDLIASDSLNQAEWWAPAPWPVTLATTLTNWLGSIGFPTCTWNPADSAFFRSSLLP